VLRKSGWESRRLAKKAHACATNRSALGASHGFQLFGYKFAVAITA
jgi:hypothetical protein